MKLRTILILAVLALAVVGLADTIAAGDTDTTLPAWLEFFLDNWQSILAVVGVLGGGVVLYYITFVGNALVQIGEALVASGSYMIGGGSVADVVKEWKEVFALIKTWNPNDTIKAGAKAQGIKAVLRTKGTRNG